MDKSSQKLVSSLKLGEEPAEVARTSVLDASLWRRLGHVQADGGCEEGHVGGNASLSWTREHFGISLDELEKVTEAREVWASLLRLLPPIP